MRNFNDHSFPPKADESVKPKHQAAVINVDDKNVFNERFFEVILEILTKRPGVDNLIRVAKKYRTGIREKYEALYQLHLKNPEDGLLDKYAACVPHVMVYVDKQVLNPQRVQRIRLR